MRRPILIAATVTAAVLLASTDAHAQAVSAQIIDTVVTRYRTTLGGYEAGLQTIATATFATLATIQFFWAMGKLVFKRVDFSEFMAELVNQIIFIGLFFWLLTTTTTWGPAIIKGFLTAASNAGAAAMSPGAVFASGVDMSVAAMSQVSLLHPEAAVGLIICALVILICFAWIAASMVIALVQSYIIMDGGVLFMMFGGSQWTKEIAVSVVRATLGIGAKLFALQLITAIGTSFIQQWVTQFAAGGTTAQVSQSLMVEIGQAIVLLAVTQTIPNEIERMVSGSSLAGAGALAGAAAELTGAAAAITMASTKMATAITGAGALTGAAGALASGQMAARVASGTAPTTATGRAAAMLGATARNVGSAVATDVGRRLSGQGTRFGDAGFRQAAELGERSRLLNEQGNSPAPSSRP